jgi:hypothetical protein
MDSARRATTEELFGRLTSGQRRELLDLLVLLADQDAAPSTARVGSA